MQCVAEEPNFKHYYSTSYRYEITNLQQTEYEDYSSYSSASVDIFEKIDKKKEYNKSPKRSHYKMYKQRDDNYRPNKSYNLHKQENVGLYRNLNNIDFNKNAVNNVDINEDNINRNKDTKNIVKPKKVKITTESTAWSLPSDR